MEIKNWDSTVNDKAYGLNGSLDDNREIIKYKGGREVYYKGNSRNLQQYSLKFDFKDDRDELTNGQTEFERFLRWGEITLKNWTLPFYFTDVETHEGMKPYRILNLPSWTGQVLKEVSLTFEEY